MKLKTTINLFIFAVFLFSTSLYAQFPPGVGEPGTTAMHRDSSAFISWAKTCTISRGFVDISDTTVTYNGSNRASYGSASSATGVADDNVVSLGDGGFAILTFENPIANGPGFDFAVFENSLNDSFLELGIVEVSSDGIQYFPFPSVSNTQTAEQVGTFGTIDPTQIHNLAGKYRALYGTPFDLDALKDTPGLDINNIIRVKVIDVVGDIDPAFANYDSQGHIINDPWPTPFNTGGFDLDAAGVIHDVTQSVGPGTERELMTFGPNPVKDYISLHLPAEKGVHLTISDLKGTVMIRIEEVSSDERIDCSALVPGIYLAIFNYPDGTRKVYKIVRI